MDQKSKKQLNQENSKFSMASPLKFSLDNNGQKQQRKFSGIAYSGEVIENHWYWGNVIFDLDSMTVPERLPALVDHNRSQRAGYVTSHSVDYNNGFSVAGNLLSNEDGQAVAQDSDEGFPWQMSVHIEPRSIEEFAAGSQVMVNGRQYTGPLTVFRNSTIVEVSFTATGQDSNTAATAMSKGGVSQPPPDGDASMTPEQIAAMQKELADLKASNTALIQERDTARTELEKFSKDRREADVKTLFSELGREYKAEDAEVKAFSDMPQATFDVTAKMMRDQFSKKETKPAAPGNLFSHMAANGKESQPMADNPLLADAERRAKQYAKNQ